MNSIRQLFNDNGSIKPWNDLEIGFHLKHAHKIYWLQNIDALPKPWKDIFLKDKGNTKNLVTFDHRIIRKSQICSLNELTTKEYILFLLRQLPFNRQHKIISRIFLKHPILTGKNIFSNS